MVRSPFDAQLTLGIYGARFDALVGGAELIVGAGLPIGDTGAIQVVAGADVLYPGTFYGVIGAGYRFKYSDDPEGRSYGRISLAAVPTQAGTVGFELRGDMQGPIGGSPILFALTWSVIAFDFNNPFSQFAFGVAF